MKLFARLARYLLVAQPPGSRQRFGEEIVETAVRRVERSRRVEGSLRALGLAVRECCGILAAGVRARLTRRAPANRATRGRRQKGRGKGAREMDQVFHSMRYAARGFLRQPILTALAVLALAIGIGASVAIFSVFHAVLLRPLPFRDPARLVSIWESNPDRGWNRAQVAPANYLDWRETASSFTDMAAHNDWLEEMVLVEGGEPIVALGSKVTGNFFDVLGVAPERGTVFEDAQTWGGSEPAVVLSHRFWTRHFGAQESVLGRTVELDGEPRRVLGVMPEQFSYPFKDADLWLPLGWAPERRQQVSFRRAHGMRVVGRLAEDVSLAEAETELQAIAARLESDYPETNERMGNGVTPLRDWIVGDTSRPLQILMAAMAFVLLVACANVANMLLARSTGRQEELKIRSALGGARRRLLLEGLSESSLLALVGGSLGLLLGILSIRPLLLLSPESLPRIDEISVDGTVLVFALGVTLMSGLVFGFVPAWRGANAAARQGAPSVARGGSAARPARRASALLVAFEIALTLPLVFGAGLMVRTLSHLSRVEPGFDPENVLVASVMLPSTRYQNDGAIVSFYRQLLEEARGIPGVEAAAMSSRLPFGNQRWSSDFTTEGWSADRFGGVHQQVRHDEISPGLFSTMGVPLLRGRDFDLGDDLEASPGVIINEVLAKRYFQGEDPIGKRIAFDHTPDASSVWRTIVGVVGNVRREALSLEEEPSFYAPLLQDTTRQTHLLVRTRIDPEAIIGALRERVRSLDPTLPLFDVTNLETVVAASLDRERFLLVLLTIAAAMALLLASVGVFGVVLHATMGRVREIGIRRALGAREGSVVALVVRGGLGPVFGGIVAGGLASIGLARALGSFLFEVEPLDPLTFVIVVTLVVLAALAACALPARWATRVDATLALRAE